MGAQEVLNVAAKTERDGIKFYADAAVSASNQLVKKMFESFVREEERHLQFIEAIMAKRKVEISHSALMAEVKTIFTTAPKSLQGKVQATDNDLKALDFGLQIERKSYDFYTDWKAKTESPEVRALCDTLAEEENRHFHLFTQMKEYLDRTGDWYMVEEGWIFDGG
jgi:rubrerythrin